MSLGNLIKAKCCCVCVTGAMTVAFLLVNNVINAGITGTVGLVYSIALLLLFGIALDERLGRQRSAMAAKADL